MFGDLSSMCTNLSIIYSHLVSPLVVYQYNYVQPNFFYDLRTCFCILTWFIPAFENLMFGYLSSICTNLSINAHLVSPLVLNQDNYVQPNMVLWFAQLFLHPDLGLLILLSQGGSSEQLYKSVHSQVAKWTRYILIHCK